MALRINFLTKELFRSGGKANAVPVKCVKCGGKGLTNVNQRLGPNQVTVLMPQFVRIADNVSRLVSLVWYAQTVTEKGQSYAKRTGAWL